MATHTHTVSSRNILMPKRVSLLLKIWGLASLTVLPCAKGDELPEMKLLLEPRDPRISSRSKQAPEGK